MVSLRFNENMISTSSKQLQSRGYKIEDDVPSHALPEKPFEVLLFAEFFLKGVELPASKPGTKSNIGVILRSSHIKNSLKHSGTCKVGL